MTEQVASSQLLVHRSSRLGSRAVGMGVAAVLMAVAANCFLKYLWWTACYSAWAGIPKLAAQWKQAGMRASVYGWSFLALEVASVFVVFTIIRLRTAGRIAASLLITFAGTGLLALALSVVKQG